MKRNSIYKFLLHVINIKYMGYDDYYKIQTNQILGDDDYDGDNNSNILERFNSHRIHRGVM